jgi:hypothetical protein
MKGADIVNRLKEVLPSYTDDFSDIVSISSLSRSGTTITAVTSSAHGLVTGNYVTIRGAKKPINLVTITRDGEIVTATTAFQTDHGLSDPSLYSPAEAKKLTVTITDTDSEDYNGTFALETVPTKDTFTYKITTTPETPAKIAGNLLLDDFDGYNGYKQITVINSTTFTYATTNTSLGSPAQGTIEMSNASRIAWAATANRADQFYSESGTGKVDQNWMFVVMGASIVYKDDTVASDLSSAQDTNQLYFYETQNEFSIYIFLPAQDGTLGALASDQAKDTERPLLKSIVNFGFDSELTEECYQGTTYVGNETEDYNTAYYVHRFDFLAKGYVVEDDTADFNPGTPLQTIDGTFIDKDMTFKPNLR